MQLEAFGWTPFFAHALESLTLENPRVGRVFLDNRGIYSLYTEEGEVDAGLSGRFRHSATELPVTGDWVVYHDHAIETVLPRRTRLARKQAGAKTVAQVLAANIDVVFLVSGLDQNFNLRRMERSLVLAWDSGATPVIVLNKADLAADLEGAVAAAREAAPGVAVLTTSGVAGDGIAELSRHVEPSRTAVLIGSSGVGKSTLINALVGGQRQRVQEVRDSDSRGRHTTTRRELILLSEGWLVMDTPGLRELQLWSGEGSLDQAFGEIAALAAACRFRDCRHDGEPGCAVARALADDSLDAARFRSFTKMRREVEHLDREQDTRARLEKKRQWKRIHQAMKKMHKRW